MLNQSMKLKMFQHQLKDLQKVSTWSGIGKWEIERVQSVTEAILAIEAWQNKKTNNNNNIFS